MPHGVIHVRHKRAVDGSIRTEYTVPAGVSCPAL
ncbi:hypothetical protein [Paenibacillus catalpae]|nr:hypothetical protein [Paenibacillus catalpae]